MRRLPGRVEPPLQVSAAPTPSSGPLNDILIFGSDEEPNGLHCGQPERKLAPRGEMAAGPAVLDAVRGAGGRERRLAGRERAALFTDLRLHRPLEHRVDLVATVVRVDLLRLPGLETIDVAEEPRGLEEVQLLHLLGGETARGEEALHLDGHGSSLFGPRPRRKRDRMVQAPARQPPIPLVRLTLRIKLARFPEDKPRRTDP